MQNLNAQALIVMALVGIVAGFLAFLVLGGGGGIAVFLITGLIGAFVGGILLNALGVNLPFPNPLINQIVTATIGAIVVVLLARLIS